MLIVLPNIFQLRTTGKSCFIAMDTDFNSKQLSNLTVKEISSRPTDHQRKIKQVCN